MLRTAAAIAALGATLALSAAAQTVPGLFFKEGAIRVLLISGRNNHDWRTTTPILRRILEQSGRFDVRVVQEPGGLNAIAVAPYDVIVLDYNGPRWGQPAETAVGNAVRTGKGLVVVHGASYAFGEMELLADNHKRTGIKEPPWTDFAEMTGASWTDGPPKSGHGKRHIFDVKFTDPQHPIARGMPPSFRISDELYHNLVLKPGIKVLARALDSLDIGGTGKEEPVLWTLTYGQGRVFHTTLGHDASSMDAPGFIASFARGVEWAASGKVTLPGEIALDAPNKDALRVQLVIGGHDFAPTLWRAFDGQPDIRTNVVFQPEAYGKGQLKDTDVLVLYDMMQAISDEQKANLKSFLESGKGMVVLHHAIANYQNWPWWYEEVVGGRYILPNFGPKPSDYKHDIEMKVDPVAEHPVLNGVGPLLIVDEAYKDMWISPKSKVLLKTDHPASDGPMAWISPYNRSKVIYIELGHGPEAHRHPGFQRLVQNAIRWAGGW
ncbi:MAG: ThuA domain-containing protein [Bryobacteraceae bacterium]|nr:ThuA domain-containing protein [Bryobacteraceae bacterium]